MISSTGQVALHYRGRMNLDEDRLELVQTSNNLVENTLRKKLRVEMATFEEGSAELLLWQLRYATAGT